MKKVVVVHDPVEAIELYYARGWTDGLPVVPATPDNVAPMIAASGLPPDHVLGRYPERQRTITVERVAVNAVLAGCKPEYMPVVVAAIEALTDPLFGVHAEACTTGGVGILVVVNGPVVKQIGLNAETVLFGHGNRANLAIGRTIRMVLVNVCGVIPGLVDRATLAHPSKIAFCIAENEAVSPWEPLHVERGFPRDQSAVTLFGCMGPVQAENRFGTTHEQVLRTIASTMSHSGSHNLNWQGEYVVVMAQEHMQTVAASGWSKQVVKEFLWQHARRRVGELKELGVLADPYEPGDEERWRHAVPSPDRITLICAGGSAGRYSTCLPGHGHPGITQSVSRLVRS
ncbi:MAG: hypothetical protein HY329_09240 [Chloroflexi bacterium]|nr:hypothetical protein [Chloroflexota bacterium]